MLRRPGIVLARAILSLENRMGQLIACATDAGIVVASDSRAELFNTKLQSIDN